MQTDSGHWMIVMVYVILVTVQYLYGHAGVWQFYSIDKYLYVMLQLLLL